MRYSLTAANDYVEHNRDRVDGKYRLKFHMMPPVGWMNDPNGLCVFGGEYHLFYQYYPYEAKTGAMHWGHFTSRDLISYRDEKVALAPECAEKISGCYSGGAISLGDRLKIIYSNHFERDGVQSETVYTAESFDGVNFVSSEMPVFDNAELPDFFSREDFRDPYPVFINGKYYVFVGGKDERENKGVIAVLRGDTLDKLSYAFSIGPFYELGDMAECPSFVRLGDKDVLLACGCRVREREGSFKNVNSSVFIVGNIDFEKGFMNVDGIKEIDRGETFYAPQCINGENDVMVGWFEMWNRPYLTAQLGHNWAGALTIPRKLTLCGGTVCQTPVDNIKKYYRKSYIYAGQRLCRTADITIDYEGDFAVKFVAENGSFTVGSLGGRAFMDTVDSNNGMGSRRSAQISQRDGEMRLILDVSGAELFACGGKETISARIYLDSDYDLECTGDVRLLVNEL